ncbi:MAG: putative bacterial DnaA helix-turn-helix protein [Prokaryotic dsDNA virus sp.]|nr:MAG: putative bacterial DnaA helix-turn-helix protein [Prokaryotic dsDNA virus sp.]
MNLNQILEYVQDRTGLDLQTKSRERSYVYARAVYFYLCREYTPLSTKKIGESLGKDHATVLHAIKKVIPIILRHEEALADICLTFRDENKSYIDVSKKKIDLLLDNKKLSIQNELLSNKLEMLEKNKFYRLSQNIPDNQEEIAYKMFLDILCDLSKDNDKTKVYSGYSSVDAF